MQCPFDFEWQISCRITGIDSWASQIRGFITVLIADFSLPQHSKSVLVLITFQQQCQVWKLNFSHPPRFGMLWSTIIFNKPLGSNLVNSFLLGFRLKSYKLSYLCNLHFCQRPEGLSLDLYRGLIFKYKTTFLKKYNSSVTTVDSVLSLNAIGCVFNRIRFSN
jgi:hypothetical protein